MERKNCEKQFQSEFWEEKVRQFLKNRAKTSQYYILHFVHYFLISFFLYSRNHDTHCTIIWFNTCRTCKYKIRFSAPSSFINEHVIVANHNVGQNLKKVIVFHRAGWLKIMWNSRKRFSTTSFIISILMTQCGYLRNLINRDVNFTKKLKKRLCIITYEWRKKKKVDKSTFLACIVVALHEN